MSGDSPASAPLRPRARDAAGMKRIALGLLAAAAALYAVATWRTPSHPAWGYVAAFAEAAMVGAIADWFAVVALFRHPLGLPIPHTAIIPENKDRIGENLANFIATHEKNSIVRGTVKSVDARGAVVALDGENEAYLRASEFSRERTEDLSQHLKVGDEVEAMIINVDRKTRGINLSIKAKDQAEQHEALQKFSADASSAASGTTNLGALLKAKLNQQG